MKNLKCWRFPGLTCDSFQPNLLNREHVQRLAEYLSVHTARDVRENPLTGVGVIRHFHETDHPVSKAVQTAIDAACNVFRSLGATLTEATLSPLQDLHGCGFLISIVERVAAYEEWARTRFRGFSECVRRRLQLGARSRT
jgi:Asp-tRNA(Asn)/Glu-tRNA(Gln) amidotransferase A subunit family amidase